MQTIIRFPFSLRHVTDLSQLLTKLLNLFMLSWS